MSETGCECAAAGYCTRHGRNKTDHLRKLCSTDQRYFDYWERPKPGTREATPEAVEAKRREIERVERLRALWRELHAYAPQEWKADEAAVWFADWLNRVPSFGCSCREHFREILQKLPPDFSGHEAFVSWSIAAHNQVNAKLGKPHWPY